MKKQIKKLKFKSTRKIVENNAAALITKTQRLPEINNPFQFNGIVNQIVNHARIIRANSPKLNGVQG
jgi:hypothetical protein